MTETNHDNEQRGNAYAFDFDGVIAEYHGFRGEEDKEPPIAAVVETMRKLKAMGNSIIVYSTRGEKFLREYLTEHNIPFDHINENPDLPGANHGKPRARVYVDDRAITFRGQGADKLLNEILAHNPYWKR